jgi:arginyl-tRNA synthetase
VPTRSSRGSPITTDPVADLRGLVGQAATELRGDGLVDLPRLERPPKPDFGDYSTNAALLLAPELGEQPRAIAERLGDALGSRLGPAVDKVEIAGPGFLNLFMSDSWYLAAVAGLVAAGDRYGEGEPVMRERVGVEFVSANPTGPITVASARHAAYGDSLCRMLEAAGHEVEREYYVNDFGTQIRLFGESIQARARGEEPPEDGYRGDYVAELASQIENAADGDPDELALRGVELMLGQIRATLERFRVRVDLFFSERSLHEGGAVGAAFDALEEREHLYPLDGAVWLRTTTFGDDKDRVLMRSSGEITYFGADIPHHEDKLRRGYDRVIDVLGADHHGYVARLRAAWQAIGGDPARFEILIMQLVNLMEGGRRAQMSKRQGEFVTLDDLLDDIGVDAARWFLLQRSHDTTLDLDLELARRHTQENPVYYVQYAHARIASILRKAGEERLEQALAADLAVSDETLHPSARGLIKRLLEFPAGVTEAADRRAPHRLTTYAHETAQEFSAFYRDVRVVGAAEEGGDEDLRIAICALTKRVLARSLDLLGIAAPEEM